MINKTDAIEHLFLQLEKIENYNLLIHDKLEEVDTKPTKENVFIELYNMQRNIKAYLILNYSISDTIEEIKLELKEILKNDAKNKCIADNIQ